MSDRTTIHDIIEGYVCARAAELESDPTKRLLLADEISKNAYKRLAAHNREVEGKALMDHRRRVSRTMPDGPIDRETFLGHLTYWANRFKDGGL